MIRKMLLAIGLMALALGSTVPSQAEAVSVGTDADNDWGNEVDPEAYPLGDALGQELVSASIDADDAGTVTFVIGLKSLPGGGVPEVSRYTWDMDVNGTFVELDGKFTNYSRGACDPTAGKCPPARDPGSAPFSVRGNCALVGTVTTCQELALVHATFDEASATISIPVPVSLIADAGACATILPGVNIFGGSISAIPSAFLSSSAMPLDFLTLDDEVSVEAC